MSSRLERRGAHIGILLVRAERRFNDELVGELHRRGFRDLRPSHGAVFANVEGAGTRTTELARRARMTKQAMGELVDDLEAKGYVEKLVDPQDRRARVVVLTARGRRVDRVADAVIEAIEREYESLLGTAAWASLRTALHKLTDGAESRDV